MVLSMLIGALYNVVDSLFVSHYGEKALSVVSLAFQNILSSNAFSILLDILAEEIQISFLEELHRIDVLVFSCSQEQ